MSGKVIIDGAEIVVPVHVGDDIPDTIMGSLWLDVMELVANKSAGNINAFSGGERLIFIR